jgi:hypothetical protein
MKASQRSGGLRVKDKPLSLGKNPQAASFIRFCAAVCGGMRGKYGKEQINWGVSGDRYPPCY